MKRILCILVVLVALLFTNNHAKAQDNTGTEFWFTTFAEGFIDEFARVYIIGNYDCTVYIDYVARNPAQDQAGIPQCTRDSVVVVGGVPTFRDVPFDGQALCYRYYDDFALTETTQNNGIRVTSTAPIALYSEFFGAATSEMTPILPINQMGMNYIVSAYREITGDANDFNARVTVVAIENNTDVTITLPSYTWTSYDANGGMKRAPGSTWTVNMNRGQTYTFLSNDNGMLLGATPTGSTVSIDQNQGLNGVKINATKRISVLGGTDATWIGNDEYAGCGAADLTCTHLKPTSKWATKFITTQTLRRPNQMSPATSALRTPGAPNIQPYPANNNQRSVSDYLLITASQNNTNITIGGQAAFTKTLNAGEWFIYESPGNSNPVTPPPTTNPGATNHVVQSDKPIQIVQMMKGWQCDNNNPADPTQMFVYDENTWADNYIITNPATDRYINNFFVLIAKEPGAGNVARSTLNLTVAGTNVPIIAGNSPTNDGTAGWTQIPGTTYYYQRLDIAAGSAIRVRSVATTPGGPTYKFSFYASGSTNAASYGYMGGAVCNLKAYTKVTPQPVCQGNPVTLTVDSIVNGGKVAGTTSYQYTWNVYSAGTLVYTYSANNNNPNHTFIPTFSGNLMATLDILDNGGCYTRDTCYFSITPSFGVDPATISALCDATDAQYNVSFTLSSGTPSNVIVEEIAPGGVGGAFVGNVWTSNSIPSGQVYNFLVRDAGGCDTVEIQGIVNCGCDSYAGTMNQTPMNSCDGSPLYGASGTVAAFLDPDDAVGYVIHTGSSSLLGTVFGTSQDSTFAFGAGMVYGTTYYISRVVGNNDGSGNVDLSDGCLSVAAGTPVRWYAPITGTITNSGPICEGDDVQLTFTINGTGPFNLTYTDANNTFFQNNVSNSSSITLSPAATTTYDLTSIVSTTSGCSANISGPGYTTTIVVNRQPDAVAGSNGPICSGDALILTGQDNNTVSGATYAWTGPSYNSSMLSPTINPAYEYNSGTYTLTISNNGCTSSSSTNVVVNYTAQADFFETLLSGPYESQNYLFTNDSGSGAAGYLWNFGDGSTSTDENPTHQYTQTSGSVTVTLIAYGAAGCNDTISYILDLTVDVPAVENEEALVYIPNSFTPDGNEYNQKFGPVFNQSVDYSNFSMRIFNRWGQMIFETKDIANGWDGTYNGELVPSGGYTWVVTFSDVNTYEKFKYEGHLNLLR